MADCPVCGGRGCGDCKQTGRFEVTACPMLWIEPAIWELIDMAEFWEKGMPPVAGGVMDQTAYFVAFAQRVFAEEKKYKKKWEL